MIFTCKNSRLDNCYKTKNLYQIEVLIKISVFGQVIRDKIIEASYI